MVDLGEVSTFKNRWGGVVASPFFFTGRYDYTDPFTLTEDYYSKIKAPEKRLVWFEQSAHFPFYEEPEKFAQEMRGVLNATKGSND